MADDVPTTPIDAEMADCDRLLDVYGSRRVARPNIGALRAMSGDVPSGDKPVAKSATANNGAGQQRKFTISSLAPSP
jgi:hypothetical protein